MILTLEPLLSSRRKVPNSTYLVAISTGMFTTLLSVHVNFSSSGRVGLVPGVHVVGGQQKCDSDRLLKFNESMTLDTNLYLNTYQC